ncbi:MAG: hypothetical protein IPH13_05155 [Planctomycetes bacterium]|nr:hypothetical protein [Planctomycetota bacterium]MCC7173390.1 hypothetical protein [Planctomycetota bacterium]
MRTLMLAIGCGIGFVAAADAGVIVVDQAGGGQFFHVQNALMSAQTGDIIVIKSGDYRDQPANTPTITAKSLVLIGEGPTRPVLNNLHVNQLGAQQNVVVRGIEFRPVVPAFLAGGWVASCAGGVLFEDCVLVGGRGNNGNPWSPSIDGTPGLEVTNSSRVVLSRCALTGGVGIDEHFTGGEIDYHASGGGFGLSVQSSSVAAFDCSFVGGVGGNGPGAINVPNDGGDGIRASASTVRLAGCSVGGGMGGTFTNIVTLHSGDGGDGLVLTNGATCEAFDTTFTGGPIGVGTGPLGAVPGTGVVAPPGALTQFAANARTFALSAPAHVGQPLDITVLGEQGDVVLLLLGRGIEILQLGSSIGWLTMQPPLPAPLTLTTITAANGDGSLTIPAPPIPIPGLSGIAFPFQAYFLGSGTPVAGSPSELVLLQ